MNKILQYLNSLGAKNVNVELSHDSTKLSFYLNEYNLDIDLFVEEDTTLEEFKIKLDMVIYNRNKIALNYHTSMCGTLKRNLETIKNKYKEKNL